MAAQQFNTLKWSGDADSTRRCLLRIHSSEDDKFD
jgi:hypothetical protein